MEDRSGCLMGSKGCAVAYIGMALVSARWCALSALLLMMTKPKRSDVRIRMRVQYLTREDSHQVQSLTEKLTKTWTRC
jgi:hypothetical protein